MKKTFLSIGLALMIAIGANAQNPDMAAKIKWSNGTVLDYGTIENGSDGKRVFKFKNEGKEPLIISNAQGSCGCTVPTWPKDPIAPGKEAEIVVTYDTKRTGAFEKTVTITSNAANATETLRIKGVVKPAKVEEAPAATPAVVPAATPTTEKKAETPKK